MGGRRGLVLSIWQERITCDRFSAPPARPHGVSSAAARDPAFFIPLLASSRFTIRGSLLPRRRMGPCRRAQPRGRTQRRVRRNDSGSNDASACRADCHTFKCVVTLFHRDQTNGRSRRNLAIGERGPDRPKSSREPVIQMDCPAASSVRRGLIGSRTQSSPSYRDWRVLSAGGGLRCGSGPTRPNIEGGFG